MTREWLTEQVLNFMAIVSDCYRETSYAPDRSVYATDMAVAMRWVADLRRDVDVETVCEDILGDTSTKYFNEYYRSGEWGERHNEAFAAMQKTIKKAMA